MTITASVDEQMSVLMRGVEYGDPHIQATMERELRQRLAEGRPLRVYCGFDPTAVDLHLGHLVPMFKMRQFQRFGHDVTFLMGTMTGVVGDPTDKTATRQMLSREQVEANAETWLGQAFRILDREHTRVARNADWLAPLTLEGVIQLGSHFTVSQFLERESFRQRLDAGRPIYVHEFIYAMMQAYDALTLETDVQIGGVDQLFNILAGRDLQHDLGKRPLVAVTTPLLIGTDGKLKMSKSVGNYVGLDDAPAEMFGKVMSITDDLIVNWFTLLTDVPTSELAAIERGIRERSLNPMDAKKRLAHAIVALLNDEAAADAAQQEFEQLHQGRAVDDVVTAKELIQLVKQAPAARGGQIEIFSESGREDDSIKELRVPFSNSFGFDLPNGWITGHGISLSKILADTDLAASVAEARRLIRQGAVRINGTRYDDESLKAILFEDGTIIQVGRNRYLRIVAS